MISIYSILYHTALLLLSLSLKTQMEFIWSHGVYFTKGRKCRRVSSNSICKQANSGRMIYHQLKINIKMKRGCCYTWEKIPEAIWVSPLLIKMAPFTILVQVVTSPAYQGIIKGGGQEAMSHSPVFRSLLHCSQLFPLSLLKEWVQFALLALKSRPEENIQRYVGLH